MLLVGPMVLGRAADPPKAPKLTAAQKERLKQRDDLDKQAKALHEQGKLAEAIKAAEAMLAIEREVLGETSENAIGSLKLLAQIYLDREDWVAAKRDRTQVLALRTKALGKEHWKVTDARLALEDVETFAKLSPDQRGRLPEAEKANHEMAAMYREGKYRDATRLARRCVDIYRGVLGESHREYATSLSNLAVMLSEQGDLTAARPLDEKVLALRRELLGERHPEYALSLNNLAAVLQGQGDLTAARPLLERAVSLKKDLVGELHPEYAVSLGNFAFLLHQAGDLAAARPLSERTLALRKEVLGEHHPEYAISLNNLALLLRDQGDLSAARSLFERALALRKEDLGEHHPEYARSLNNLGHLLHAQGDLAGARLLLERALAIYQESLGERHPLSTAALNNLSLVLSDQGDFGGARSLLERVLAHCKEQVGERHLHYAISLSNLASLLRQQGDLPAARPLMERAVAILKGVAGERHPSYISGLNHLAILLLEQGELPEARSLFERGLALRKEVLGERHPEYSQSLANLAMMLRAQGDLATALPLMERAVSLEKELLGERHPKYAVSLNNLAILHLDQGNLASAQPLMERALAIRKMVLGERHLDYAQSLLSVASALEDHGDLAGARSLLERALVILKEAGGERNLAYIACMSNLGLVLLAQGNLDAARPLLERVVSLRKQVLGEHHPNYATSLNNLAGALKEVGDLTAARPLFEHALAIRKHVLGERHPLYLQSLNNMAGILHAQGDLGAARKWCESALSLRRQILGEHHPDYAASLNTLAAVLFDQGDLAAARPLMERALTLRGELLGKHHPAYAEGLNNLAVLSHVQGDLASARDLYEGALAIRRELLGEGHPLYARCLDDLAMLSSHQGDLIAARQLAERSLEICQVRAAQTLPALPEREQIALLGQSRRFLWSVLTLSAGLRERGLESYRHILTAKGISFMASSSRAALEQAEARSIRARIEPLRSQLTRLYYARVPAGGTVEQSRALRSLSERLTAMEIELARAVHWQPQVPEPDQAADALSDRAALVDLIRYGFYSYAEPAKDPRRPEFRYAAFVVRRGARVRRVELGSATAIDQELTSWRDQIQQGRSGAEAGEALAKLVWEPLRPHLADVDTVLISPDGDLAFLPWAALPDRETGSVLLQRYAFAVVGSGRQLVELAKSRPAPSNRRLLAVGGVDYGKGEPNPAPPAVVASRSVAMTRGALAFDPLPGTVAEANAVVSLFRAREPQADALVLDGPKATKERLRAAMPGHRYLHLATHGYFAPPELKSALTPPDDDARGLPAFEGMGRREAAGWYPGLLSGLVCAGATNPPKNPATGLVDQGAGVLTAEEVSGLDLKGTDLVVLSACETGLGRVAGGEGVLGLQRAFEVAGARTVIASLWDVGDEATQRLMAGFYKNLWEKKLPKLEALRQAQLALLREYQPRGKPARGGLVKKADRPVEQLPERHTRARDGTRLPPFYWAAFVLSGDWH
jgi:CHAT domain-containing protein/tetratricopeptide (TPR) repeat protein